MIELDKSLRREVEGVTFWSLLAGLMSPELWACLLCGAATPDPEVHAAWHARTPEQIVEAE